MPAIITVAVPGCRCWHCIRIAELVDVCQVLRSHNDNLHRDLKTEREGAAMLLAERKRMEGNNLDLAGQLDEACSEYLRGLDAADKACEIETRSLRDELNYWRSLCDQRPQKPRKPRTWPAVLMGLACFAAGVAFRVWAEGGF